MTSVKMVISGIRRDLDLSKVFVWHASRSRIIGGMLHVHWLCETDDEKQAIEECCELVDVASIENAGCKIEMAPYVAA